MFDELPPQLSELILINLREETVHAIASIEQFQHCDIVTIWYNGVVRPHYEKIKARIRERLKKALGSDAMLTQFIKMMEQYNGHIFGSFILQCILNGV